VTIASAGQTTTQATQTISGAVDLANVGTTVTLFDGATAIGTATVQSNGSWSTAVTLAVGAHAIVANDTDVAGNVGTSNTVNYTINATNAFAHAFVFSLPQSASATNVILGDAKANTLVGTAGADLIDGKAGADTMSGGAGDDTYVVDNARDKVIENVGAGVDTVQTTLASYVLPTNVENGRLIGTSSQTLNGNSANNLLFSNDAGSRLSGGAGNDVLVAGKGADSLTGGVGNDVFRFDKLPSSAGHVTDFTAGQDVLDVRALFGAYVGHDPIADGWAKFVSDNAGGSVLMVDVDGPSGPAAFVAVTTLDHVLPGALTAQTDWIFY